MDGLESSKIHTVAPSDDHEGQFDDIGPWSDAGQLWPLGQKRGAIKAGGGSYKHRGNRLQVLAQIPIPVIDWHPEKGFAKIGTTD